jgi:uncharacterized phage protein (TIGR01671 family)
MRTIKFRAWLKAESKMCGVDLLRFGVGAFLLGAEPGGDIISSDGKYMAKSPGNGRFVFAGEFELMQFTGLHDKNGKKIYEGDIVQVGTEEFPLIMKIEFVNASFCQCNEKGNWIIHSHDKLEVIGNIFENPDLL